MLKKGTGLAVAAVAIGILTALSGAAVSLASDFLADSRHGTCIQRYPGDIRSIWHIALDFGWRPYDRKGCCGGAGKVDHATGECRAPSIIQHSTNKRFATALKTAVHFGSEVASRRTPQLSLGTRGMHTAAGGTKGMRLRLRTLRHTERSVSRVSDLIEPDTTEFEDAVRPIASFASEVLEDAETETEDLTEDVMIQTQSESVGSTATYEWVPWERSMARGPAASCIIYVMGSAIVAMFAASVTRMFPAARGSGIPDVKANVAGFALPKTFLLSTLIAKCTGLAMCVGAGLAVGKEGPMIHIGAAWGTILAGPISGLGGSSGMLRDTELVCVGAAAGVSAAFGAPLGGVLFAIEELGTSMMTGLRYSTMICAFGSACVAALMLKWLDLGHTGRLTVFEVDYKQTWAAWEAIPFALLGVAGGILGGTFVLFNEAVHRRRLRAQANGRLHWLLPKRVDSMLRRSLGQENGFDGRVIEVVLLAVVTTLTNYPFILTRLMQGEAINQLFSRCPEKVSGGIPDRQLPDPIGLCGAKDFESTAYLASFLLYAVCLRLVQTAFTFGALVPAGLFVPSIFIGGCLGRAVGSVLRSAGMMGPTDLVEPGVYAMVGAGAMLAGVSRLTISLVVVLFELTGGLTYVVPFMLSCLTAKWVGDMMTHDRSVYDVFAQLNGFTKVEQNEDVRLLNATLRDVRNLTPHDASPPFWVDTGLVRCEDLSAHCRVACQAFPSERESHGFTVLRAEGGDVEVLGWAKAAPVCTALIGEAEGVAGGHKWCRLWREAGAPEDAKLAPYIVDLSSALEPKGVIRVRSDCSVLTLLCIFTNCPNVRAVVSIEADGYSHAVQTITRADFVNCLVNGSMPMLPAMNQHLDLLEQASGGLPLLLAQDGKPGLRLDKEISMEMAPKV